MAEVFALHHKDLEEGYGEVYIPEALLRKYPSVAKERGWQWLFPSRKRSIDPRSGKGDAPPCDGVRPAKGGETRCRKSRHC